MSDLGLKRVRRRHVRRDARLPAVIYAGSENLDCLVTQMSEGGARLAVERESVVRDRFALFMGAGSPMSDCAVVWRGRGELGIRFL
jgi:hypothetical protein